VNFGPWVSVAEPEAAAPDGAGVLQVRTDGLQAYPTGRSAMVLYGYSRAGQSLHDLVLAARTGTGADAPAFERARALGARWIRFAPSVSPEADFARLLRRFVERFGAPPAANGVPDATI
jgi:hypothetical protein